MEEGRSSKSLDSDSVLKPFDREKLRRAAILKKSTPVALRARL
jgi:hypothetical protein